MIPKPEQFVPLNISILAPARGATPLRRCVQLTHDLFQSSLPRGERPPVFYVKSADAMDFNPRSREGSDFRDLTYISIQPQFQSSLPRGERQQ